MTTIILSVTFKDRAHTLDVARRVAARCEEKFPDAGGFIVSDGILQSYVECRTDKLSLDKRNLYKKFADEVLHELAPGVDPRTAQRTLPKEPPK